ncbi:mCG1033002, partial [Mus musculus]
DSKAWESSCWQSHHRRKPRGIPQSLHSEPAARPTVSRTSLRWTLLETIPSSRVDIHLFALPARSLEEASRQCSHLVMSFWLPRWISAGRSYN